MWYLLPSLLFYAPADGLAVGTLALKGLSDNNISEKVEVGRVRSYRPLMVQMELTPKSRMHLCPGCAREATAGHPGGDRGPLPFAQPGLRQRLPKGWLVMQRSQCGARQLPQPALIVTMPTNLACCHRWRFDH